MLSMKNVSRIYRTDVVQTHALRNLSLEVEAGEFVALVGPSGSGKTTFLNIAGLLETFDDGSYQLDGRDVAGLNDNDRSRLRNEKIGFIFQSFNLIPELNIADNIDVPLRYRGFAARERKRRVDRVLEVVGLGGRKKHLPSQLSGGQQQRVAIARALAGDPGFLLADEPTGNLDSSTAAGVMELINEIHRNGATIIMVTHDLELAARAERIVRLSDGQVVLLDEGGEGSELENGAAV
ncbi:MAG: ABC transporter ATP-binding protein [Gammaproteobacteria bacterium]|nr:ABC transporter ATP-binding protein [Gammaproteobacteria bacterium]